MIPFSYQISVVNHTFFIPNQGNLGENYIYTMIKYIESCQPVKLPDVDEKVEQVGAEVGQAKLKLRLCLKNLT